MVPQIFPYVYVPDDYCQYVVTVKTLENPLYSQKDFF